MENFLIRLNSLEIQWIRLRKTALKVNLKKIVKLR